MHICSIPYSSDINNSKGNKELEVNGFKRCMCPYIPLLSTSLLLN